MAGPEPKKRLPLPLRYCTIQLARHEVGDDCRWVEGDIGPLHITPSRYLSNFQPDSQA